MIRAIVVDDEPSLLEIAKRFLESEDDIQVNTASTARQALEILHDASVDAVVSDYRMSDMNGLEFLKALRESDPDVPFILFTGHGREEVAMQALNFGADFYLQKGGDPRTQFAELRNMITSSVQRRRAATMLRDSEEGYRHLLESSPALICRLSPEGETLFVSGIVSEYTKYSPDDLRGSNWWRIFYPGDLRKQVDHLYHDYFDKGLDVRNFQMRLHDRDGAPHTMLWNSSNRWDPRTGELLEINGAAIDATRRIEMQENLRRSEQFNRAVLNSIDANIAVLDSSGNILTVNDSWKAFREENGGMPPKEGARLNYLDVCRRAKAQGAEGASEAFEGIRGTLDGSLCGFSLEYPCHSPDTKRWFLMTVSPLSNGALGAVVAHIDITTRKLTEEALVQTNRKLSLLSDMMRHDGVNHLTAIQGNLDIALMNAKSGRNIDAIGRAMDSVRSLLRYLEFSREYQSLGEKSPEWIDLQSACENAVADLDTEGVSVNISLKGLQVFADPMLEKVFHNLVSNALRHGETLTTIELRFRRRGKSIVILCEDDGVGITWDRKNDIFARGIGRAHGGFGLYLAQEVLNITNISISETGTPGRGARFEIVVPSEAFRLEDGGESPVRQRIAQATTTKGDVS